MNQLLGELPNKEIKDWPESTCMHMDKTPEKNVNVDMAERWPAESAESKLSAYHAIVDLYIVQLYSMSDATVTVDQCQ